MQGALAAEREILTTKYGVDGAQFDFPTNGSGTPDSRAAPRALVQMLTAMSKTPVADQYLAALPVLGEDGSLATTGTTLPGKGHVFAKPGTTISPDANGVFQLKAQNLAGYIETKSGRTVAYALMVNDAGPVDLADIDADVGEVFEDEADDLQRHLRIALNAWSGRRRLVARHPDTCRGTKRTPIQQYVEVSGLTVGGVQSPLGAHCCRQPSQALPSCRRSRARRAVDSRDKSRHRQGTNERHDAAGIDDRDGHRDRRAAVRATRRAGSGGPLPCRARRLPEPFPEGPVSTETAQLPVSRRGERAARELRGVGQSVVSGSSWSRPFDRWSSACWSAWRVAKPMADDAWLASAASTSLAERNWAVTQPPSNTVYQMVAGPERPGSVRS